MKNYKQLYYEKMIEEQKTNEDVAQIYSGVSIFVILLIWIFNTNDYMGNIILTIILLFIFFIFGFFPMKLANKKIKRLENENLYGRISK